MRTLLTRRHTDSVLPQQAVVPVGAPPVAVATARSGRASMEKAARRENILVGVAKAGELSAGDYLALPPLFTCLWRTPDAVWSSGQRPTLDKRGTDGDDGTYHDVLSERAPPENGAERFGCVENV